MQQPYELDETSTERVPWFRLLLLAALLWAAVYWLA